MADYLFVSQDMIDGWLMEGKIDFSGTVMSIRGEKKRYQLQPAVRFVRVLGDEADSAGLVAKVKTLDQVAEDGGEHYHDSVILGDVAYEVQNGFIARVHVPDELSVATPESAKERAEAVGATSRPRVGHDSDEPASSQESEGPPHAALPEETATTGGGPSPRKDDSEAPTAGGAKTDGEEESDASLLTRFLLENLK